MRSTPHVLILASLLLSAAACRSIPERTPVPAELSEQAKIPGIPQARYFGDQPSPWADRWLELSRAELAEKYTAVMNGEHNYLAISGGGQKGAWGAGLLVGWSEAGTRPEFTVVTGVSTGSLIAPFAFLGADFDDDLRAIYTSYSTADLAEARGKLAILSGDSAADTTRMRALIAKYYDAELVEAVAVQHRRGRLLSVGTTDLDTQRPVVWNLSAIAASDAPDRVQLFGDILMASAALPGAFPPVRFTVEAAGHSYQELHTDGGCSSQVYLYPLGLDWSAVTEKLGVLGAPTVYVIRNDYREPTWHFTEQKLLPIVGRSIDALFRTQGLGDLYRIYLNALRDGIEFRLTFIPTRLHRETPEPFDREYMGELFERARALAAAGYPWESAPPGVELERSELPSSKP